MSGNVDRALKMLSAALEKEEFGRDTYKKAIEDCGNDLGKEIFKVLMAEEGIHIKRIKAIYEELSGGKPWSEGWRGVEGASDDLQTLFRQRAADMDSKVKSIDGDLHALHQSNQRGLRTR